MADDHPVEYVPEFDAFFKLTDETRLFFSGSYTTQTSLSDASPELTASVDITLTPILRKALQQSDWRRDRYLWMRIGYDVFGDAEDRGSGPAERRGILQLTAQTPLDAGASIWLSARSGIDFRNIGGETSQRFRFRLALERDIAMGNGLSAVPYVQAEDVYDSRYNIWNQQTYQTGVEFGLTASWRIEAYFARVNDSRSVSANADQVGFILKYFR